ncbi:fumarylacetoacetate hydrolase family protein [Limobrevibacterium gyesilva]|uniref:Fumarylacetoacetate hydrolase family protein n=1 Tax=Limobrevibacterium gyesilva TaxID=2991712 RepID=A0AA42CD89_9PROT|nr:fumarylacetoacetate hydrolase family protein [Limobrevibacterium gyesilva]MCW3474558.1 fumarylacetoacetate hydrolase family protein [Limobrevibacterium gyesilva]
MFSLVTVRQDGLPVGCLERDGQIYRLADLGAPGDVAALFADWPRWSAHLAQARLAAAPLPAGLPVLAPLQYPGKILCAGANYYDHCAEMGVTDLRKEAQRLFFFFKPPRNAVVGPGATVRKPIGTQAMDWEIELAAVIGTRARNVSVADALAHVAAYTVAIDFSARDFNRAPETFYKLDWVAGKAHDTCCPMGPRLVPAAAIGDPQDLGLTLSVNGVTKQDARSSGMIFSVAEQIATASRIMTLDPGDVILTGTPAGVGAPKQTFLSVGDTVAASIEKIGTLSVVIQPEG